MKEHSESKESLQQTVKKEKEDRTALSSGLSGDEIQSIVDREYAGVDEKDKEGKQRALERALTWISIEEQKNKSHICKWEYNNKNGRYYCPICGEDGGSPWDC
jgi:hypothetical protein